jgi:ubiquinone/menaquinone biosynthesis C-methylase UbiE
MPRQAETVLAGHYFLAVHGLALIRNIFSNSATATRCSDAIQTIASELGELPHSLSIPLQQLDVEEGYTQWAPRYDGPNPAIEAEQPVVHGILADLPIGVALDAACGTGRHAAKLAELGHQVIGVDTTGAMLDLARAKVPGGDFRIGLIEALPVEDASVDIVTCALALTHVPDLEPVVREFGRVLRPGGTVVLSDIHPINTIVGGGLAGFPEADLTKGIPYVENRTHHVSDYISAFNAAELSIVGCLEPTMGPAQIERTPSFAFYPEASHHAFGDLPQLLIWELRKLS